jgi:hypothetical protein
MTADEETSNTPWLMNFGTPIRSLDNESAPDVRFNVVRGVAEVRSDDAWRDRLDVPAQDDARLSISTNVRRETTDDS